MCSLVSGSICIAQWNHSLIQPYLATIQSIRTKLEALSTTILRYKRAKMAYANN